MPRTKKPTPKPVVDDVAVAQLQIALDVVASYKRRVSSPNRKTGPNYRFERANELLNELGELLDEERDGWTDL